MQQTRTGRRNTVGQDALLSHSTILILSGVLIAGGSLPGAAAGTAEMSFWAGLSGVLAFAGLRLTARRRARQAVELARRMAIRNLEIRIDRHIPRQAWLRRPRTARTPKLSMHQYVTVVRAGRMR